jgi:hypothetical protein
MPFSLGSTKLSGRPAETPKIFAKTPKVLEIPENVAEIPKISEKSHMLTLSGVPDIFTESPDLF